MRLSQFVIDVEKPVHVAWWAQQFDVTEEEVVRAVAAVGNRADAVQDHLASQQAKAAALRAELPATASEETAREDVAARREVMKRLWVAPAVVATALPRAGFAANISGSHPGPHTGAAANPEHGHRIGHPGKGS